MKNKTFSVIIDKLIFELNKRMKSFIELKDRYGFL